MARGLIVGSASRSLVAGGGPHVPRSPFVRALRFVHAILFGRAVRFVHAILFGRAVRFVHAVRFGRAVRFVRAVVLFGRVLLSFLVRGPVPARARGAGDP
ncbi:hypothetical protein GCM10010384_31990 [Streptomyces djakartensis]|uniref:Uncharacterized protein n=1 Tax=Streptomyces djakartensis TaxID=68193 RepID=A0ABQ2ZU21_9ACTN|nr:hypothetical protein GCM10010384_31990 [Streptomyces djakartensis]